MSVSSPVKQEPPPGGADVNIFRHLKLPAFNFSDQFHLKMVSLSKQAHSMGIDKKNQSDIDSVAWDIVKAMPLQPGHEER